jgi:hypothetical protein
VEKMSGTGRGRAVGARLRIAAAVAAVLALVLGFGPASGVSSASTASPAASASSGQTQCAASGSDGTTCTNTYSGDTAWDLFLGGAVDPDTGLPPGAMTGLAPSVTVDQTSNLTNQIVQVSWANFTPSMNSDFVPGYQYQQEVYGVGVFQCKGTAPTDFTADCNDLMIGTPTTGAPATGVESYTQSGTSTQPTDCTIVPDDTVCGTGFTDIQIQTSLQNSTLGCSSTVACSLVVLPFWGGNLFPTANCADHSQDLPGGTSGYASDTTHPWESPCTWADRITVPLTFAPTPQQYCPANGNEFSAQGSPLLERAFSQWQPGWCTGANSSAKSNFNYDYTVNEDEARSSFLHAGNSLSASADVALVTDPASSTEQAGSSKQYTYAPIATTSITIAFYVDNQVTQEPITDIKLDARLVAKLLTQSYSLEFGNCPSGPPPESDLCDPAVGKNPVSIFTDPEFYQLNPEYTQADFATDTAGNVGDFLPVVLSGNSDMTYELTRWVESDPHARQFLEGQPDPWGMHVNYNYEQGKSQSYPVSEFQTLDAGFTATLPQLSNSTADPYLATMQVAWNPVSGLDNVAADLAGWTPSGDQFYPSCSNPDVLSWTQCTNHGNLINAKDPADQFPQRALFAIMDSGTAAAYRFPTAQLVNPAGDAVASNLDSMTAAVNAMKTNPDGITQYTDFNSTAADAYPLTEVQYAMVPTCGQSSAKASAISTFLDDVAGSQDYGPGLGQIPDFGGYLALDDAQQAQTQAAATAVAKQTCKPSKPDTSVSGLTPPPTGSSNPVGDNAGNPSPNTLVGNNPSNPDSQPTLGASSPANGSSPTGPGSASASAKPTPVGLGEKAADTSGDMRYILPIALVAGGLLAIGGPLAYGFGTAGGLSLPRQRKRPGGGGGGAGSSNG